MTLAIDLFSGGGGATIALEQLGLDVVGFELNADACATHHAAGHRTVRTDLRTYPWGHLAGRIDVLHASPPCQPFSAAGSHAGQLDPRDGVPWTLRAVAELRPRLVTVENVKGLTFRKHTSYLAWFLESLRDLGYTVDHRVLNAADFGVPQTRERLFVIARNDGVLPKWPDPTHTREQWVSMAEALGWDEDVTLNQHRGAGFLERGGPRRHRPASEPAPTVRTPGEGGGGGGTYWTWQRPATTVQGDALGWGGHRDQRPDGALQIRPLDEPAPTVSAVHAQWWRDRPATTVNGDPRISAPGHHAEHESGSQQRGAVRVELHELAVLQGFPPDYPFVGTSTSRARQIGNAVPPPLLAAVLGANLEEALVTPTDEVTLDELDRERPVRRPGDFRRHPITGAPWVYNVAGELTADGRKMRSELYGRASSKGERLVDRFALERRDSRLIVTGLRLLLERGELLGDDLDAIVGRCLLAADAWLSANRGTALHSLWEDPSAPIDYEALGLSAELLEACRLAIDRCLERHGIEILGHELTIVNDLLRAAGTADAFGRLGHELAFGNGVIIPAGTVVVIDLKSGLLRLQAGMPLYWAPYSVQLAIYAGGCRYIIDGEDERREPFPWRVSQAWGLILHVGIEAAVDTDVATAQLWCVDLATGRSGGELVLDTQDWARLRPFAELEDPPTAVTVETDGPSKLEVLLEQSLELVSERNHQAGNGDGDEGDGLHDVDGELEGVAAEVVEEQLALDGADVHGTLSVSGHDATVDDTEYGVDIYRAWLQERIDAIGKHSFEARRQLQVRWPSGIPPLRRSDEHTDAQLAAIESCLDDVEAACSVPFGPTKPGTTRHPADHGHWLNQLIGAFPNSRLTTKEQ